MTNEYGPMGRFSEFYAEGNRYVAEMPEGGRYFTDKYGTGLWVENSNGERRQLLGTGQFKPKNLAQFRYRLTKNTGTNE